MLSKLTKQQEQLMYQVRDEWIRRFFSLEFDEDKARKLIRWLYKLSNLKEPLILIMDSPIACQIATNLMSNKIQVGNQVRNQVGNQVRNQKLQYFDDGWRGIIIDYAWVSFYDFFDRLNILDNKEWNEFKELIKTNIFYSIQLEGICVISKPPSIILRDNRNRLHNKDGSAIVFNDGYEQHYVHGVFFEKELYDKIFIDKTMKGKDIIKLRNAEQKSAITQALGYSYIIDDITGIKIIDTYVDKSKVDGNKVTYEVLEFPLDNNTIRIVKVEDHTEHKITYLGVPIEKSTETCMGAIAWTFNMEVNKYKPIMES